MVLVVHAVPLVAAAGHAHAQGERLQQFVDLGVGRQAVVAGLS